MATVEETLVIMMVAKLVTETQGFASLVGDNAVPMPFIEKIERVISYDWRVLPLREDADRIIGQYSLPYRLHCPEFNSPPVDILTEREFGIGVNTHYGIPLIIQVVFVRPVARPKRTPITWVLRSGRWGQQQEGAQNCSEHLTPLFQRFGGGCWLFVLQPPRPGSSSAGS
jgi:hypothetical protein